MDLRALLFAEAVLGRDAEEFLSSDIGRYIVGAAQQEERAASELLASTAPWRRRRIQELQNRIWRSRSVQQWLAQIVTNGKQAEWQIESANEETEDA